MTTAFVIVTILGFMSPGDLGTTAVPFLKVPTGPRPSAMGEAFTALADDVTALYWNPAGLGQVKHTEFFLSHQEWFADIRDEYAGLVLPLGPGRFGLGLTWSGTGDIERWDAGNLPGPTLSSNVGLLTGGYGVSVAPNYYLGGAVKLVYDYVGEASYSGTGAGFDLGFLARPWRSLDLGASLQNVGAASYADGLYSLPTALRLGGAWRGKDWNVVADFVLPGDNSPYFNFGGEYTAYDVISLRGGYKTGPQDLGTLGFASGLCLGLGVRISQFSVDYSFVPYGNLGAAHRVGLRTVIPERSYGKVRVTVTDQRTRDPLPAVIELSGLRTGRLDADEDGRVEVGKLSEGWLKVRAMYPGYIPVTESVYVKGTSDRELRLVISKPSRGSIYGTLIDAASRKALAGKVTWTGPAVGAIMVREENPTFTIRDLPDGEYLLTLSGPNSDYIPQSCTVRVEPGLVATRNFQLLKKKAVIILKGVEFETAKADLLPAFLGNLDAAGRILQENPGIIVEIGGHTDPREIRTAEFPSNQELSQARAEAVRKYLIEKFKIKPERLVARGYAATRPIADHASEDGMARNRRTEFVVLEQ